MPHMYILRCGDGSYYVGSARHINERMQQHFVGQGSTYTSKRMPVELVYAEEFERIDALSDGIDVDLWAESAQR